MARQKTHRLTFARPLIDRDQLQRLRDPATDPGRSQCLRADR